MMMMMIHFAKVIVTVFLNNSWNLEKLLILLFLLLLLLC